ncbi:hypothetical protein NP493_4573g00002 [Ridgeia piscesae]|uniref:SAM-dependent MTase RsmB/NOP-type domain-containing protein n=1 Tax=Ridgeia piscesae TaxID=27915 RepID=A0AAD9IYI6_RIDPI|nr:hypothetical protein NP493_4573g00002 [Ridgeia piscesae]
MPTMESTFVKIFRCNAGYDLTSAKGRVVALDKSASKREKLLTNVHQWSASCVEVYTFDSSRCIQSDADITGPPPYPTGSFDRVLLDAPCSALGQRPSCRNKMTLAEVKSYPALQRKIFTKAVEAVKEGGVLVYSTCTIPVEENEHQVAWALQQFPCLRLDQQTPNVGGQGRQDNMLTDEQCTLVQRLDPRCIATETPTVNSDTIGFFIAKFVKLNYRNAAT